MSNLGAIFDVLASNSEDVEEIVSRFGGVGNLIKAAPALFRIVKTIAAHNQPVEAAEAASRALLYSNETRKKVMAFQERYGLEVDGLVGNQTWAKVESLIAAYRKEDSNG